MLEGEALERLREDMFHGFGNSVVLVASPMFAELNRLRDGQRVKLKCSIGRTRACWLVCLCIWADILCDLTSQSR